MKWPKGKLHLRNEEDGLMIAPGQGCHPTGSWSAITLTTQKCLLRALGLHDANHSQTFTDVPFSFTYELSSTLSDIRKPENSKTLLSN